jgi:hypothetical protein
MRFIGCCSFASGALLLAAGGVLVASHPHAALTSEQIDLARSIFAHAKSDPNVDPASLLSDPLIMDTLETMFGGVFDRDELLAILLDIFYTDEMDETGEEDGAGDVIEAEAVTGDGDAGGEGTAAVVGDDHSHRPILPARDDKKDPILPVVGDKKEPILPVVGDKKEPILPAIVGKVKENKAAMASDMPSDIPSDMPSDMPSDLPSSMPSDVPSTLPSDVPSITPLLFDGSIDPTDKTVPKGFLACPQPDGTSAALQEASKLTIMYGYRLELQNGAEMNDVIKAVEDKVTRHLLDTICEPDQALAVSSEPKDTPGGECGPPKPNDHVCPSLFLTIVSVRLPSVL